MLAGMAARISRQYLGKSMIQLLKTALLLSLGLYLSSCATTPPVDPSLKLDEKVVVTAKLYDEMNISTLGFTIFGNSHFSVEIPDWNLDTEVEEIVARELHESSPIPVEIASTETRESMGETKLDSWSWIGGSKFIENPDFIAQTARAHNASYVLVILSSDGPDFEFLTNQQMNGFGVFQFGMNRNGVNFMRLRAELYDGYTGKILSTVGINGSRKRGESAPWAETSEQIDQAYFEQVHGDLLEIVRKKAKKRLPYLRELKLPGAPPLFRPGRSGEQREEYL